MEKFVWRSHVLHNNEMKPWYASVVTSLQNTMKPLYASVAASKRAAPPVMPVATVCHTLPARVRRLLMRQELAAALLTFSFDLLDIVVAFAQDRIDYTGQTPRRVGAFETHYSCCEDQDAGSEALAIGANGAIWTASRCRIEVFNAEGISQRSSCFWKQRIYPSAIAFAPWDAAMTQPLLTDRAHRMVRSLESQNRVRKLLGGPQGPRELEYPWGLAVDQRHIYVADTRRNCVAVWKHSGRAKPLGQAHRTFGSAGAEDGQFRAPRAIALNGQGQILVADYGNNRIQVFEANGAFVRKIGGCHKGQALGEFDGPVDLACDAADNVMVCDARNCRVQVFRPDGSLATWFPVTARACGLSPCAIAIGPDHRIYIASGDNIEIYSFDLDP